MIELLVECLDAFAAISPPTNQPTDIVFHVPHSSAHIIFIPIRWQFWQFSQDFSSNALLRVFDVIFCFGFDSKHFFFILSFSPGAFIRITFWVLKTENGKRFLLHSLFDGYAITTNKYAKM